MYSGRIKRLAVMLVVMLLVSVFALPAVSATEAAAGDAETSSDASYGTDKSSLYFTYLKTIAQYNYAKEDIVINPLEYTNAEGVEYDTADGKASVLSEKLYDVLVDTVSQKRESKSCLVWSDNSKFQQQGKLTYVITVPEDGIYNLAITYLPLVKSGGTATTDDDKVTTNPVELSFLIDGKLLYPGLDGLSFPRHFVNNGSNFENPVGTIREDTLGNQLTSEQVDYGEFVTKYAIDPVGVVADPYQIFLSAGTHTITLESIYEPVAISEIIFKAPKAELTYEQYAAEHAGKPAYSGTALEIEGEDAWIKSTNSLISKSDNSSSDVNPNSPVKSILNYIGNTNWQVPGETLTWKINVPEDGLYTLGMNFKQSFIIDGFTYRSLSIDDKVPFAECKNLRFNYNNNWEFQKIGGKNPYQFYLTKGIHTISLTVTLGETAEFYSRLSAITEVIGNTYMDIVMITGASPDPNRSYELFKQIPGFQETLLKCYTDLKTLSADMKALSGDRSSKYISALNNMSRVLKEMYDNQYTAQVYVKDFYSNYTTVCSWLYEMKTMPLSLDQIQLAAPAKGFKDNSSSFWESLKFGTTRFFASFSDDFSSVGGSAAADSKGSLKIWVNWGRDQTQVLSNLIHDSFTYETGIGVEMEIVTASLVNGLLAGNFPDLQLHLGRTTPVNLGMRGALYDLTNFSAKVDPKYSTVDDGSTYLLDYETVLKRFQNSADTPYWYNDGTDHKQLFALPDTQNFYIMYYRTDVFDRLGISDPALANDGKGWTWTDFLDAATILQRNNMAAYIPYTKIASITTVNVGMGGLHLFPTFLTQNNVALYNEAANKTTLTSSEAISAFTQWTDLYTKYGIEKQIDFYNRFRTGTAPLGVATYTTYNQLTQTAPEIQGRWKICAIPGIMQEDGTINRSIGGSGTGCSVVKASPNKDAAWQFLCWWTSADTQLRYNNNVESILGAVSRTATANTDAFALYSWNADDLAILQEQWSYVTELPEVPGGYYVSRAVDQAYWAVLNGKSNEKDAMLEWGEVADNEIIRKILEYAKK